MKKVLAGSTISQATSTSSHDNLESLPDNTWTTMNGESFHLRIGPNYEKMKSKAASGPSYYELAGVDFVRTVNRLDNIGSKVSFPEEWFPSDYSGIDLPPIFILHAQIPSDFSIQFSFFTDVSDGEGWSLVLYFKLKQETIDLLRSDNEIPPALRLLLRYCREAPNYFRDFAASNKNPWAGRFKAIGRIDNIERYNLPNFITSYNAKPVLIKTTGNLIRGDNYLEMDVSLFTWGNIARQGLNLMFYRFGQMVTSIGFCIESLTDEEMPENIFGCGTLIKLDPVNAANWEDLIRD